MIRDYVPTWELSLCDARLFCGTNTQIDLAVTFFYCFGRQAATYTFLLL